MQAWMSPPFDTAERPHLWPSSREKEQVGRTRLASWPVVLQAAAGDTAACFGPVAEAAPWRSLPAASRGETDSDCLQPSRPKRAGGSSPTHRAKLARSSTGPTRLSEPPAEAWFLATTKCRMPTSTHDNPLTPHPTAVRVYRAAQTCLPSTPGTDSSFPGATTLLIDANSCSFANVSTIPPLCQGVEANEQKLWPGPHGAFAEDSVLFGIFRGEEM